MEEPEWICGLPFYTVMPNQRMYKEEDDDKNIDKIANKESDENTTSSYFV